MAAVFFTTFFLVTCAFADVEIRLVSNNNSAHLRNYADYMPFRRQYANTGARTWNGSLYQPTPNYNACVPVESSDTIKPHSHNDLFLLVDDYPSCVEDMVKNVKKSNYTLVITSSRGDTQRTVSNDVTKKLQGLSIVLISEEYAGYLKQYALTNLETVYTNSSVTVHVNISNATTEILIFWIVIFTVTVLFVVLCITLRWRCVKRRRNQNPENDIQGIDRNRRSNGRSTTRTQRVDAYLQSQYLQTSANFHSPLGEHRTKQLPLQWYTANKGERNACAICVDEFVIGAPVRVLPCGHIFHSRCVDKWFVKYSSLCPLCKQDVLRETKSPVSRTQNENDSDDCTTYLNPHSPISLHQYGSIS